MLIAALLLSAAGCAAPKFPPADFSAPGWIVRDIPALWRPSAKAGEMTGELLWAKREDDGSLYVQFSKGGLPILMARRTPAGWSLGSALRPGSLGGRGRPPSAMPWFQLNALPPAAPPPPWTVDVSPEGRWILANARTGEQLEGVAPAP